MFSAGLGARIALGIAIVAGSACSLALDFDKPVDASPPDSPATDVQCAVGEPNDTPSTATAWTQIDVDAAICGGGDRDYYAVTLTDGQTVSARITFMNRGGMGDLDLRLLSGDGATTYDESRGAVDTEEVLCPGGNPCPALTAGTYVVEVQGFAASVVSPYLLHITIGP